MTLLYNLILEYRNSIYGIPLTILIFKEGDLFYRLLRNIHEDLFVNIMI